MKHRALLSSTLMIAFTLAGAGCAGTNSSGPDASPSAGDHPWTPTSSTSTAASTDPLTAKYGPLPLHAFGYWPGENGDISSMTAAIGLLMTQCMKEKGFDYRTGDDSADELAMRPIWHNFLHLTDMTRAQTYGYQAEDLQYYRDMDALVKATPTPSVGDADKAYDKASSGCADDISKTMPKPPKGISLSLSLPQDLEQQAMEKAQADSAVRQALAEWVTCMASSGYNEETPPGDASIADVTQADIDKAVTDVTCKQSSNLTDTFITTLYQTENNLIASHRSELDALATYEKTIEDWARKALSENT